MQELRSNNEGTISTIIVIHQQAVLEEPGLKMNGRNKLVLACAQKTNEKENTIIRSIKVR